MWDPRRWCGAALAILFLLALPAGAPAANPQADLSVTKTDGQPTAVPGTSVTYTIVASNAGPSAANGATVTDTPPAPLFRPTLAQHVASSANPVGLGISGNAFKIPLPNAVGAGNCLVLGISYAWSASRTVAVTDDNGNAWPGPAVTADPPGGFSSAIYVLPDANAGPTTITVTFDADVIPFQYTVSEFYDVATASPVNGTSATAAMVGPALTSGTFTPGNNDASGGNLIWSYFALAYPASHNPSRWTPAAGFALLDADIAWNTNQGYPHASEYRLQAASAALNPGITATGDTDAFNGLSVALKAASAGTAPPAGIRIVRVIHMTSNVPPSNGNWNLQVPTTGNLTVLTMNENVPVIDVTGITDSRGNSYTRREPELSAPQIWHTANSTPDTDLMVTLAIAGNPATASVVAYDVAGAAASPFDVEAAVPTTTFDNQTHIMNAPTIAPTTANGLVIAVIGMGQGPVTGLDAGAPAGAIFDLVTYAGEEDTDLMENADGKAHVYNTGTATEHWNWVGFSAPSNSYFATAVAFKAAASNAAVPASARPAPKPAAGVTWTCVGSGGATCSPSGSGSIDDTVNLPVGGTVTYTLTGTIDASATGTISNTVTIAPPVGIDDPAPGNNSATDTDTLTPQADLAVTKTDSQAAARAGMPVAYTIVASNAGPSPAAGATVADTVSTALTAASWTCTGSGGGTCAASGSGDISDTVDLPVGASVTYVLSATVSPTASSLSNTASVSAPNGVTDPSPANNAATDADLLICGDGMVGIADGRLTPLTVAAGGTAWLGSTLKIGDSYSLEVENRTAGVPPGTLTVLEGDDGCASTSTLVTNDTSAIDPGGTGGALRRSFTATGSQRFFQAQLQNTTGGPVTVAVGWSDTTQFSAAWSTNGSFDTFFSFQNTASAPLAGTLTLLDTAGVVVSTYPVSIPPGQTASTSTVALAAPRNRTGTARLTHNGPPGSVVTESAIANFAINPAYVQPVKFQAVREAR